MMMMMMMMMMIIIIIIIIIVIWCYVYCRQHFTEIENKTWM